MKVVILDKLDWKVSGGKIEKIEIDERGIIEIKTESANVSIVFDEKGASRSFEVAVKTSLLLSPLLVAP